MPIYFTYLNSPLGNLLITASDSGLTGLYLPTLKTVIQPDQSWAQDDMPFTETARQLSEYFAGTRTEFSLPLDLHGTVFQTRVWAALQDIPYGQTASYGAIASLLEMPRAARAIGTANGRNPLAIIVPCHRVVGAGGAMTGYNAGLEAKRYLLHHEQTHLSSRTVGVDE